LIPALGICRELITTELAQSARSQGLADFELAGRDLDGIVSTHKRATQTVVPIPHWISHLRNNTIPGVRRAILKSATDRAQKQVTEIQAAVLTFLAESEGGGRGFASTCKQTKLYLKLLLDNCERKIVTYDSTAASKKDEQGLLGRLGYEQLIATVAQYKTNRCAGIIEMLDSIDSSVDADPAPEGGMRALLKDKRADTNTHLQELANEPTSSSEQVIANRILSETQLGGILESWSFESTAAFIKQGLLPFAADRDKLTEMTKASYTGTGLSDLVGFIESRVQTNSFFVPCLVDPLLKGVAAYKKASDSSISDMLLACESHMKQTSEKIHKKIRSCEERTWTLIKSALLAGGCSSSSIDGCRVDGITPQEITLEAWCKTILIEALAIG
jgi:hypothetical protein